MGGGHPVTRMSTRGSRGLRSVVSCALLQVQQQCGSSNRPPGHGAVGFARLIVVPDDVTGHHIVDIVPSLVIARVLVMMDRKPASSSLLTV